MIELRALKKILDRRGKIDKIDEQTMTCQYENHTIFSIFHDEVKLHEAILQQLDETDYPDELQEDETELQNNVLRRLYRVLILPVPNMKPTGKKISKKSKKEGKIGSTVKVHLSSTAITKNN